MRAKLALLGSLLCWCITDVLQVWAGTSSSFPIYPPLQSTLLQEETPSNKVLVKLKKITTAETWSRNQNPQTVATLRAANHAQAEALATKLKVKMFPLLTDDPKKEKLNPRLWQVYIAELPTGGHLEETLKAEPSVEYAEKIASCKQ